MTTARRSRTQVAAVVLLVLAWGSTFAAVKIGLDSVPPILFAGLRSVVGGAVMVVLALARSGRPSLRSTWPAYAVLTLLNVVLFFSLQSLAILELPSGLAAVLIYLQPVLVGVLAAPLLGESLTVSKIAGLLLGFGGIVVVSVGAFSGHVSVLGVGYAVVGALIWALGTIAFKSYGDRVDVWWSVAIPFLVGGTVLTLGGAATEGIDIEWSGEFVVAFLYAVAGRHRDVVVAVVRAGRLRGGGSRGVVHLLRAAGLPGDRLGVPARDARAVAAGGCRAGDPRGLPRQPPAGRCR